MDFHRNTNGMLGFGIDESGVVRKVDGLAKTTGLQVHSRILQVLHVYVHVCIETCLVNTTCRCTHAHAYKCLLYSWKFSPGEIFANFTTSSQQSMIFLSCVNKALSCQSLGTLDN